MGLADLLATLGFAYDPREVICLGGRIAPSITADAKRAWADLGVLDGLWNRARSLTSAAAWPLRIGGRLVAVRVLAGGYRE